eukprot:CAMPEP_0174729430 /NCGR_PEP_ID=MMETSP1094-20130205/53715_1 /TAXON_ID=156173 /ORGANISM="Chrysochromulina brevifilum, Strain UTEX LB 985" /LENGTH=188 /DNA_ID=CAMNT_0015931541 /DNA_START=137 /DNA_END=704 /DNA_ORIENTATION=-
MTQLPPDPGCSRVTNICPVDKAFVFRLMSHRQLSPRACRWVTADESVHASPPSRAPRVGSRKFAARKSQPDHIETQITFLLLRLPAKIDAQRPFPLLSASERSTLIVSPWPPLEAPSALGVSPSPRQGNPLLTAEAEAFATEAKAPFTPWAELLAAAEMAGALDSSARRNAATWGSTWWGAVRAAAST